MSESVHCPMFVDYVRECLQVINDMPDELKTMDLCTTEKYVECPFFRYIQNMDQHCPYFIECALCQHFKSSNFERLIDITKLWCLNDFSSCVRYQIRLSGEMPPPNLMPDGTTIDEFEC